ncbi:MAG: hypothetical protein ACIAQZ_15960 [Sedimentisphaeraceae bacterium JB056]
MFNWIIWIIIGILSLLLSLLCKSKIRSNKYSKTLISCLRLINICLKVVLVISIICLLCLVLRFVLIATTPYDDYFTIKNQSGVDIRKISIEVAGQIFVEENLRSNETVRFRYRALYDSHYTIQIEYCDGKILEDGFGYVTGGLVCDDKIIIQPDKVEFESNTK